MSITGRNDSNLILLALSLTIGIGCSDDDFELNLFEGPSTSVATTSMRATMSARASQMGSTRVTVSLDEDEFLGDDLYLAGGERLEATIGGQTQTLVLDPRSSDFDYFADFPSSSWVDPIQVRFFRAGGAIVDSPVVFLRPDFSVTSPLGGQMADFMDVLLLEWISSEPMEEMRIRLELTCMKLDGTVTIRNVIALFDDDGSASYDLSLFPEATNPLIDQTVDCGLDVEFDRVTVTSVAPPFGAGEFRTTQSRTVEGLVVGF